jgi:hypothetical protein
MVLGFCALVLPIKFKQNPQSAPSSSLEIIEMMKQKQAKLTCGTGTHGQPKIG